MIRYALRCDHDHRWEAWFDSIASYENQQARGLVECPICGSAVVDRAPMAPAVVSASREAPVARKTEAASEPDATAPQRPLTLTAGADSLQLPEPVRAMLDDLRTHVRDNCDYVGDTFAREARAIHEGTSQKRQIYGEATPREARELLEDGIPVAPLPDLAVPRRPKDVN